MSHEQTPATGPRLLWGTSHLFGLVATACFLAAVATLAALEDLATPASAASTAAVGWTLAAALASWLSRLMRHRAGTVGLHQDTDHALHHVQDAILAGVGVFIALSGGPHGALIVGIFGSVALGWVMYGIARDLLTGTLAFGQHMWRRLIPLTPWLAWALAGAPQGLQLGFVLAGAMTSIAASIEVLRYLYRTPSTAQPA